MKYDIDQLPAGGIFIIQNTVFIEAEKALKTAITNIYKMKARASNNTR